VLEHDAGISKTVLASKEVRNLWRKFLQKARAIGWSRPWSLYVLARWCEINEVTPQ